MALIKAASADETGLSILERLETKHVMCDLGGRIA